MCASQLLELSYPTGDRNRILGDLSVKQMSIRSLLVGTALIAAFFAGWAAHQIATDKPSVVTLAPDPAVAQFDEQTLEISYDPRTFRHDLESLIEANQFVAAMHLLDAVRIDQQIAQDGEGGYYSIGGNVIQNPGADAEYIQNRDYLMPGTGSSIDSLLWHDRAYRFAEKYNTILTEMAELTTVD